MIETKILRVLWKVVSMLVIISYCSVANGEVIRVDDDGQADFSNIQAGIDAAVDGDTVLVEPGEYVITEPITFRGKAIIVKSEAGPEATTIRMSDSPSDPDRASVIVFESGEIESSILNGFTISGGQGCRIKPIPGYGFIQSGGAILCWDSSPTVTDCIITGNQSISRSQGQTVGGGVYLINSSATLDHCLIRKNLTTYWGAGLHISQGAPKVIDCVISENTVMHQDGQAGGLAIDSGVDSTCLAVFVRCLFSENSAPHSAGGIQVSGGGSRLTFRDCQISDNKSFGGNGGILCSYGSETTMTNCIITRNSCVRIGCTG